MKVAFRVDASDKIGTGHVIRCLTLAIQMRRSGDFVLFICRELPGHLCEMIESFGFDVSRLPAEEIQFLSIDHSSGTPHASWLGVAWQTDAAQTYDCMLSYGFFDWLIVDHYAIDYCWEKKLRPLTKKLMVIDDLFDRKHEADLLLNQSILSEGSGNYNNLIPYSCKVLLGPEYALLRDDYKILRDQITPKTGKIERLFIYFGGIDRSNFTGKCLEVLEQIAPHNIEVDVVMPTVGQHKQAIVEIANRNSFVNLHYHMPSLSKLMARADLAIGAAGTTSWERLCLGLPSYLISLAKNQLQIAKILDENGLAVWLGHHDNVTKTVISESLKEIFQNGYSENWSTKCRASVDGLGVNRVYEHLSNKFLDGLEVRHVEHADFSYVSTGCAEYYGFLKSHEHWEAFLVQNTGAFFSIFNQSDSLIGFVNCVRYAESVSLEPYLLTDDNDPAQIDALKITVIKKLKKDNELFSLAPLIEHSPAEQSLTLCTDRLSWINDFIPEWVLIWQSYGYKVTWLHDVTCLPKGEICFFLGCSEIVKSKPRGQHKYNLVVHESDLPKGRGWSPLTWQILEGSQTVLVSLIEAAELVDAGDIYSQTEIELQGNELVEELRNKQASATFKLCDDFITGLPSTAEKKRKQIGSPGYYNRRTPKDSELNVNIPLVDQFDLLRVCDNERYPAWFSYKGRKFVLRIDQSEEEKNAN